ncbi:glycerol-3-phosphate dehydrogenase/oxidase [Ancylobacter sp. WKF20]|uniref:glycerol-3-phosphate dehydrogenase/oxidase n=1 Tax=Ancylobacter sp. WKF20 TaxID=3039801 RepID=UPI002434274F|nr:glycerol-3-phosphate dehydrogenase/oxidase [Ancylobacter sp. WKF20]WGD30090.1 glycerol-3-phosphate dehydrogenase/oxidase [Ancylobacter sp. WKF20]
MQSRDAILAALRSGQIAPEVLIIGAGINGVGVFRDLALQGVPSLLVDMGDICSATSAASSRLIHGGLRYLEIGEFSLVRESVEERNRLLLDAPHLVRPIRVRVPIADQFSGALASIGRFFGWIQTPGPKGALVVALGLRLYDLFNRRDQTMPNHRMVPRREFRAEMPALAPATRYVAEYYDARLTAPERLGIELVAQAEAACPGAAAATYLRVAGREGGQVELEDVLSGERFSVTPRLVVNCAGARVDEVDGRFGIGERLIGGTKGSHLVLRNRALVESLAGCMIYFETPDHRICLAYPLDDNHALVGTTDLRTDDPGDTVCSDAEIDYLFEVMALVMPSMRLAREEIVHTYAGIRPLPASEGVAGAISRDHSIRVFPPEAGRPFPVLSLVGGKWTTFRACAEQIADQVLEHLGRPRQRGTAGLAIGGGADWPRDVERHIAGLANRFGITPARAQVLFERYGTAAAARLEGIVPAVEIPLTTLPDYSYQEITAIAREERVVRLEDIVLRRTQIALLGQASHAAIAELGAVAGAALGWSQARIAEEVVATDALIATRHSLPERTL